MRGNGAGADTMTDAAPRLPDFLTIDEIAQRLKVSTKTVRRWIDRGELRVYRLGGQIRVSEEDLFLFMNKHYR